MLPFALFSFFFFVFLLLGEIHAHRGKDFQELLAADNRTNVSSDRVTRPVG